MTSAAELRHLPVMPDGASRPLVDDVASVATSKSFGQIEALVPAARKLRLWASR
jgi:hypothetical protein